MGRSTVVESKTYDVVLASVEERLRSGDLRIGDRLPSERALAEEFGISRTSVREAVRVLDAMGLVRSGVGSGPNAGAVVVSEPSAALGWGLRMHLASDFLPVRDVVATRVRLEAPAAADAARAPDSPRRRESLARAARTLEELRDPELGDERFHELDGKFHLELAALAGNVVVSTILASLRQATTGYVQEGVGNIADWADLQARLNAEHESILAAVRAGDAEAAAERVTRHIEGFYEQAFQETDAA